MSAHYELNDDGELELQPSDADARPPPEPSRPLSRASTTSSCTLRGDDYNNEDDSIGRENPDGYGQRATKRYCREGVTGSSRSSPHALNSQNLTMLSNGTHASTRVNHGTDDSSGSSARERARWLMPDPPRSGTRGAGHGARGRGFHFDVSEYIRDHPGHEVRDGRVRIDLEALELEIEEEFNQPGLPVNPPQPTTNRNIFRSPPVKVPWIKEETFRWNDSILKAGKTLELQGGNFMFIVDVVKNLETDEVKIRGWQLKRCSELGGILRKALNELAFLYEVELDDPRPAQEQSIIETDLNNIVKIRRLVRTNYRYPHYKLPDSVKLSVNTSDNMQYARENDGLVVRWKYTVKYNNRAERLRFTQYGLNIRQRSLEGLSREECSPDCYLDPLTSRYLWRGETVLGGSGLKQNQDRARARDAAQSERESRRKPSQNAEPDELLFCPSCDRGYREFQRLLEHFESLHNLRTRSSNDVGLERSMDDLAGDMAKDLKLYASLVDRIYTFGDTFCGAGGTTRGALLAGLLIKWGLDVDKNSAQTWRKNFPWAKHFENWASEFVAMNDFAKALFVDVLHLSPPCQVWSPVHTVPGQNDKQNFASLFACEELLKKSKPRMVTLEQTFGILHPKFSQAFNSLIQMFTFYGYSVSWQLVEFQRWGLAQSRKRLIIIAAGPGETLPEIPKYTHAENPGRGLQRFTSVASVLNSIPRIAPNHDIDRMLSKGNIKAPWDASGIISCITCNGGGKIHPSGRRNFTHREVAALQSFPICHIFCGHQIRKQIGNAVPPMIAKIIYRSIIKHLEKIDGVVRDVQVID